tara:strand:+ start:416 stop:700 length:285 start_codon:yes stop_codon:yes gene_type:complete
MSKISIEDVKKIAAMTKLHIEEDELEGVRQQLESVLSYAERVQQIAKDIEIPSDKNINHDREDSVITFDNKAILSQAPQHEDNYFVVPKIVDSE